MKKKEKSKFLLTLMNLAILLFSTGLTLIGTEYVLKVLSTRSEKSSQACSAGELFNNPFFLKNGTYEPYAKIRHCGQDYDYIASFDRNGFRNSDGIFADKPKGLSIGDSFDFGFGVKDGKNYSSLLGLYDVGIWGNTFDVHIERLKHFYPILKPRIVLWDLYPPHLITMMNKGWGGNCPGTRTILHFKTEKGSKSYRRISKILKWLDDTATVRLLKKVGNTKYLNLLPDGVEAVTDCYLTKESLILDPHLELNNYTDDLAINRTFSTDLKSVQVKVERYFKEARELTRSTNSKIYFLLIPSKLEITLMQHPDGNRDPYLPLKKFKEMILMAGFPETQIIDLSPLFEHDTSWKRYFFEHDAHWNEYGHKAVAEYIQSVLSRNGDGLVGR